MTTVKTPKHSCLGLSGKSIFCMCSGISCCNQDRYLPELAYLERKKRKENTTPLGDSIKSSLKCNQATPTCLLREDRVCWGADAEWCHPPVSNKGSASTMQVLLLTTRDSNMLHKSMLLWFTADQHRCYRLPIG